MTCLTLRLIWRRSLCKGFVAIAFNGCKELGKWVKLKKPGCRTGQLQAQLTYWGSVAAPFLIMCMVSIPAKNFKALQNDMNPSIGSVIRLTVR